MDVQLIECRLIDEAPRDKAIRSFKREFATNLADSIRVEGMLNPITVRPNPGKHGRYILVAGRHRLYAKQKILKERAIECNVLADMDQADHDMATLSENLWRQEISKAQRMLTLQKWHEYYSARHAAITQPKSKAADVNEKVSANLAKTESASDATQESTDGDAKKSTEAAPKESDATVAAKQRGIDAEFVRQVAAVTGQSERSTWRQTRLAKLFSADDLEVFKCLGTTQQQMEAIAAIKDPEKRRKVIALIASGLDFAACWQHVFGGIAKHVEKAKTAKAEKAEKAKAAEEQAPELTDDEWFDAQCSEKAKALVDSTRYKQAALLYRRINEARMKFRSAIKKIMADEKAAGRSNNFLYSLLNRVISMSHPRDFFICEGCSGNGTVEGKECGKCKGGCFQLRTEKYM
jgi:ParB/RepB/Spo0J family partition protein